MMGGVCGGRPEYRGIPIEIVDMGGPDVWAMTIGPSRFCGSFGATADEAFHRVCDLIDRAQSEEVAVADG